MSLATRIESLVIRVAQEFNDVRATAGNLASLSTTDKSSLVAAINELKAAVLSATAIDDNQIATSTTYSSNKIVSLLDALTHPGLARVWVSFGYVGGQIVIGSAHNVASVVRTAAGRYRVHFALAMRSIAYTACSSRRWLVTGALRHPPCATPRPDCSSGRRPSPWVLPTPSALSTTRSRNCLHPFPPTRLRWPWPRGRAFSATTPRSH